MTKFVVYNGPNGEIFVTTKKNEEEFITDFFSDDAGREIDDFDRTVVDDCTVAITVENNVTVT